MNKKSMAEMRIVPGRSDDKQLVEIELKAYEHVHQQTDKYWWQRLLNKIVG
jgi:hypothetical protein